MFGDNSILRTHQISAAIIDLIDESKTHCYLVTPWVRPWQQLERSLQKAAGRGLRLTFILRHESKPKNVEAARALNSKYGAEVILLPDLHTKLYLGSRRAIVGSMNLYDVSQTRNFELAYQLKVWQDVEALRKEVLEGDLLAVKPLLRLEGTFESDRRSELTRLEQLERELSTRGHCVTCGDKMELERKVEPRYVRCKMCYYKAPEVDEARWWIRCCHLCGEPFDSVLGKPLHPKCKELLAEYVSLKR